MVERQGVSCSFVGSHCLAGCCTEVVAPAAPGEEVGPAVDAWVERVVCHLIRDVHARGLHTSRSGEMGGGVRGRRICVSVCPLSVFCLCLLCVFCVSFVCLLSLSFVSVVCLCLLSLSCLCVFEYLPPFLSSHPVLVLPLASTLLGHRTYHHCAVILAHGVLSAHARVEDGSRFVSTTDRNSSLGAGQGRPAVGAGIERFW